MIQLLRFETQFTVAGIYNNFMMKLNVAVCWRSTRRGGERGISVFCFDAIDGEGKICTNNCKQFFRTLFFTNKPKSIAIIDSNLVMNDWPKKNNKKTFVIRSLQSQRESGQSFFISQLFLSKFSAPLVFQDISSFLSFFAVGLKCFNKDYNWCKMKVSSLLLRSPHLSCHCAWLLPLKVYFFIDDVE